MDKIYAVGTTWHMQHFGRQQDKFVEVIIDSETSRSWVINTGRWNEIKIAKKTAHTVLLSDEDVDNQLWLDENRRRIIEQLGAYNRHTSIDLWRKIAALIDYQEVKL